MALIGTASVLAALALAASIYWAAAVAPPDSAPGVVPFIVAFVGAAVILGPARLIGPPMGSISAVGGFG